MRSVPLLLALQALTACASDQDPSDQLESDQRISPRGVDDESARVIFVGKNGVPDAKVTSTLLAVEKTTADILSFPMARPELEASFRFESGSSNDGFTVVSESKLLLKKSQDLTVKMASLKIRDTETAAVVGLSAPATEPGTGLITLWSPITPSYTKPVLIPPGVQQVIRWGLLDGLAFTATPGESMKVDLADTTDRGRVKFVAPVRELPSVDEEKLFIASKTDQFGRPSQRTGYFWGLLKGEILIGYNTKIMEQQGYQGVPSDIYEIQCNQKAPVPYGAVGGSPTVVQIGRIDVDDVRVTLTNGGTESRRGTYRVFKDSGEEVCSRVRLETNTGIDVLPGTYRVEVSYTANSGQVKVDTHTVTFP